MNKTTETAGNLYTNLKTELLKAQEEKNSRYERLLEKMITNAETNLIITWLEEIITDTPQTAKELNEQMDNFIKINAGLRISNCAAKSEKIKCIKQTIPTKKTITRRVLKLKTGFTPIDISIIQNSFDIIKNYVTDRINNNFLIEAQKILDTQTLILSLSTTEWKTIDMINNETNNYFLNKYSDCATYGVQKGLATKYILSLINSNIIEDKEILVELDTESEICMYLKA